MDRLKQTDELPYRFIPPRLSPFWVTASRPFRLRMLRKEHRVEAVEVEGVEHLRGAQGRGDGVIITPNHSDRADGFTLMEIARAAGKPFSAMAAHQLFEGEWGLRSWLFSRLGIFPVDRDGSSLSALKTGIEIVSQARWPLAIFPEGEVYYLGDRLTPLRDGAAALAIAAHRTLAKSGKTVRIVPIAIKYRFLDHYDPLPALRAQMSRLEAGLTWRPAPDLPLVERLYRYARGVLALKEEEHLSNPQSGEVSVRIANLRSVILERIEERRAVAGAGKRGAEPVPVRVKEMRKRCLDLLAHPETTLDERRSLKKDLDDLFLVLQMFSYPGDYVREQPTLERVAETLTKCEQDIFGSQVVAPRGPRKAVVRIGEPIVVQDVLSAGGGGPEGGVGKARTAAPALTSELERRIQALLDRIGPGRLLPPGTC